MSQPSKRKLDSSEVDQSSKRNKSTPELRASPCHTMADDTEPALHMDTTPQPLTVVAKTKDTHVATEPTPQSSAFMKLPLELTLDIVELVVSQDALHSLERSKSGERLGAIWYRLFSRRDICAIYRPHVVITWQMTIIFAREDEFDRYTYRPRVPALMHTNYFLRKESREAYLKFARAQMALYEAKHQEVLPSYERGYEQWVAMDRSRIWEDKETRKLRKDLQTQTAGMAERAIRWFAMNEICKVLE
jgi:hypothetical protein